MEAEQIKPDEPERISERHRRDFRAVQRITTRLEKSVEEPEYGPDKYVRQGRLKRIVSSASNRKRKPLPIAFLTAVARVVVPARPETRSAAMSYGPESTPSLLRLHEVKRAT